MSYIYINTNLHIKRPTPPQCQHPLKTFYEESSIVLQTDLPQE